ncbi:MAG: TonB-dependent receptor [Verrucomicrobiota bacterium]|nr:TonB-dependent receptor [Verrucomicrobiota bacterium]
MPVSTHIASGTTTAPPPPAPGSIVYSFRNTDAVFYGAETARTLHPTPWLSRPTSITVAHGYNRQTGIRLPDIPPWELQTGLRLEQRIKQLNGWVAVNNRLVGSRTNPTPQDNPLYQYAPSFSLWDINCGISYHQRIRLEITVDNLFNRHYHEYLSPRVNALGSNQ